MNINKEQIDELNAIVKIAIYKEDYQDSVEKILKDYKKQANIPGFRKGQVPMGLIKKQYGKSVLLDEVNKLLQDKLNKYLIEEKLDILGQPLPKLQENFDWDNEILDFEFELGLAPHFEIQLKTKKAVTHYTIVADKKTINEQVTRLQKQHGPLTPKEKVEKSVEVIGTFTHEAEEIEHKTTVELDLLNKKAVESLLGQKVGASVSLATKTLFKETRFLAYALNIKQERAEELDVTVSFVIEAIHERQPAALDQELFDTLYKEGQVTSEKELRDQLKESYERQFEQVSDQKLLSDFTEKLIEKTTFDLPSAFLQKWIQHSGETPLSEEEAKEAFENAEKGLRYQLIEGKLVEEYQLQPEFDELKAFVKESVKSQIAQLGIPELEDEKLEPLIALRLNNEEEVKKLSEQLMSQKLLNLYKEKANLKTKKVTYEEFVKEAYS